MKNIYAYTETNYVQYPAYISLNLRDGRNILSVRTREGNITSEIEMSDESLKDFATKIINYFECKND